MADTPDLGSGASRRGGSSPPSRTFPHYPLVPRPLVPRPLVPRPLVPRPLVPGLLVLRPASRTTDESTCTYLLIVLLAVILLSVGCASHHSPITTDHETLRQSRNVKDLLRSTEEWFAEHTSTTRLVQRALLTLPSHEPSTSLTIGGFTYFDRPDVGAAADEIWRSSKHAPDELVYSATFGRGGYPFVLSHLAPCAAGRPVALFGTIGSEHLRCIRTPAPLSDPRVGKLEDPMACEAGPEIAKAVWDNSCHHLYVSEYEEGRAVRIVRLTPGQDMRRVVLLEESDPQFSLSMKESEDRSTLIFRSESPRHAEIWWLSLRDRSSSPRLLLSRDQKVWGDLIRAFDRWFMVWRDVHHHSFIQRMPPDLDSSPRAQFRPSRGDSFAIPVEFSVSEARGSLTQLLALGLMDQQPTALSVSSSGEMRTVPFPTTISRAFFTAAQSYAPGNIRLQLRSMTEGPRTCDLLANPLRLDCDEPRILSSSEITRIRLTSFDGTPLTATAVVPPRRLLNAAPVLISYGAYGAPIDTSYRKDLEILRKIGIPTVFAHIRGGGDGGIAWHTAALGTQRLTAAQDLIASAQAVAQYFGRPPVLWTRSAGAVNALLAMSLWSRNGNSERRLSPFSGLLLEAPFINVLATLDDPSRPGTIREYHEWGSPDDPKVREFWRIYLSPELRPPIRQQGDLMAVGDGSSPALPLLMSIGTADEAVAAEESIAWFAKEPRLREETRLLQLIPGGTHDGARHSGDELKYLAERIVAASHFAGVDDWSSLDVNFQEPE